MDAERFELAQNSSRPVCILHGHALCKFNSQAPRIQTGFAQDLNHMFEQVRLNELFSREIHRYCKRWVRRKLEVPGMHLAASLSEHKGPDPPNQASFLGDRDEPTWCNQAKTRSLPSEKNIKTAQI